MTEVASIAPASRWVPTRAGLIALWRYWDETFVFHRGRLLLRGPNGSGKSMALELLLPFLLDGDTSPTRLTSAAKSRGRLFDRVMTGTDEGSRTGFAWVEFRRGDDVFTVGARMRASHATGKVDVDLFTTALAVGRDLHLLDSTRTPLSRKALVEAIGDTGRVHSSADEHRAAVRDALFSGFDGDRYASVISALLALRKEKLSQNLDLDKLSDVLSDALPPIDEHDVATVAEGFERLDRRRAELADLERELEEVRQLARRQRDYARAVVVGAARHVRSAETRRDDVTRNERLAREALAEAEGRAISLASEREELDGRDRTLTVSMDALKDSEAYRAGAGLADLRRTATLARDRSERAGRATDRREEARDLALTHAGQARDELEETAANLGLADRDLREAAEHVGASAAVAEARTMDDVDAAERFVRSWATAQRTRVGEVRLALDAHDAAVTDRSHAEGRIADDERTVDERMVALDGARAESFAARGAYRTAVEGWIDGAVWLRSDRLALAVVPALDVGPRAVETALAAVVSELRADEATRREQIRIERQSSLSVSDDLIEERRRWEQPGFAEPPAPDWRSDRSDREGAPLWRLVDVLDGVPAAALDGVESALAAAGIVDAWVEPDGRVDLGPDRSDLVLTAGAPAGRSLASVLAPSADADAAGVRPEVVASVLASVALVDEVGGDDGPAVAVATDGGFRLGSAIGRAQSRPATLLGSAARERHRLHRLAEIDALFRSVAARLAELDREDAALDRSHAAIDAEVADLPSGAAVAEADAAVARAEARLEESRERLAADRERLREAEEAVRSALRALTATAAEHGLPADRDALTAVEEAIVRLVDASATWARRRGEHARSERAVVVASAHLERAERDLAAAHDERERAEREASDAEQRVRTLESSVGAEYVEILKEISRLEAERRQVEERADAVQRELLVLTGTKGALEEKLQAATREREQADEQRADAHRHLVAALAALRVDARVDVTGALDGATEVLAAARSIQAAHEAVESDDQAVEKLSERVNERVHQARAALGARVDFDRELMDDGWWVLRTMASGIRRTAADLAVALDSQLDEGRRELEAEEEHLFEQTLAGSVRRALADRIRQANALVDGINDQLSAVKTVAGGVQVRLTWDVDTEQPPAVKAARSLLLRDPADLTDSERASLQDFVRARVDQARAELEANAPWEARLRETLDYRSWHRFSLQLAHRDWQGFQPATARRLQRLSTGERSIALHLPMIASLAAHYASEDGTPSGCPRLILLDELFAGVDAANRAQLFGTFTTWDLDAVFTSDHEWCQYATLDGIAIHHLHPPTGEEPVTSTRFTWDGQRRTLGPVAA